MIGLQNNSKNILRAYSIVSAPWDEELEFLSIKINDGELTSKLQHIKVDDEVIMQPKCVGTLRNEALTEGKTLWMLATGTGLAPFMSLIRDIETLERWNKIKIVCSVRNEQDLAYNDSLTSKFANTEIFELTNDALEYIPIVTGNGDDRITTQLWREKLPIQQQDKIMICGNKQFNKDVITWCKHMGLTEGTLRTPGDFVFERAFIER